MDANHDLSFLDLKDHFEVVDPTSLELTAEESQPAPADPNEPPKPKSVVTSMERHGLLECPLVAGKKVIDGAHRVRAAIELGRQFILIRQVGTLVDPAIILAHSYLVRRPVTVLREAEQLAGFKIEYEAAHPETTKGGNAKAKKAKKEQSGITSFCGYVAELTGRDVRMIQRRLAIGSLPADARAAIHKDEDFANREDKLYALTQCGKGDVKDVTPLEVFNVWQANGKGKSKTPDGEDSNGKYTFFDCVNALMKQKKMSDPEIDSVPLVGQGYEIRQGDFRDLMKEIPDASIDTVITDPPYLAPYLHLLPAFIRETGRVLKPNGFAVIMFGQNFLNVAITEFEKQRRVKQKENCLFWR